MDRRTFIAGGGALLCALAIPASTVPTWANIALGLIAVTLGAIALHSALSRR